MILALEPTTEEQQETDDRQARAQVLGDLEYQRSHEGLDTWQQEDGAK